MAKQIKKSPVFTEYDQFLFREGTHYDLYHKLGAQMTTENRRKGVRFSVWAPHAHAVSVLLASKGWGESPVPLSVDGSGVWSAFVPGVKAGEAYRFLIAGADGQDHYKSDPMAFQAEKRPANASVVAPLEGYVWQDAAYQSARDPRKVLSEPMSIYEVHLGSWKKRFMSEDDEDGFLNYRELADQLAEYVNWLGFTHVELIGICEHPFDGSWGYQVTGFYAPTSRFGSPDDFRYFVDRMHQAGIGVILDWVPAHFPRDAFGLAWFDGAPLYESEDPLLATYPEWSTNAFDHSRPEVRSFLISNAFYWLREFHVDALRVDAVAAMLNTNFSRGEWRPNKYGGTENLESIAFIKQLNTVLAESGAGYLIAEDSSIMRGITAPVSEGGLGFKLKWSLGWMNDTLKYLKHDPIFRKWHHGALTYIADYAFTEQFVLVLSHDEVVHLKHAMVEKFPGSLPDRLAALKTLYAFQFTFPGKKLLFMGQEFAQEREWSEKRELDWWNAEDFGHRDVLQCVRNLAGLYRSAPCLYVDSGDPTTFEWVERNDADRNVISYIRRNPWNYDDALLVVCNFSPAQYNGYWIGVPEEGYYSRAFSTYDSLPGAGGPGEGRDIPPLTSVPEGCSGRAHHIAYDLRPYEAIVLRFPKRGV